jgi:hypothetical protein
VAQHAKAVCWQQRLKVDQHVSALAR